MGDWRFNIKAEVDRYFDDSSLPGAKCHPDQALAGSHGSNLQRSGVTCVSHAASSMTQSDSRFRKLPFSNFLFLLVSSRPPAQRPQRRFLTQ